MDEDNIDLILALQLQDIEDAECSRKGKAREAEPLSDEELAIQLQREEYQQTVDQRTNRRMAESMRRAVEDHGASIVVLGEDENRAASDREMACRLGGHVPETGPNLYSILADDDAISRFSALNIGDDDANDAAIPFAQAQAGESSLWASTRRRPVLQHECISCMQVREVVLAPCQHHYCRDCIVQLFNLVITDETLFPPRCCRQQIPVSSVRHFLGTELAARFQRKAIEYGTTDRTYCHDPSCASFIEPGRIQGSTGRCPRCQRSTCTLCKKRIHAGDCLRDDGLEEALALAEQERWRRCGNCQNMVELATAAITSRKSSYLFTQ